MCVPGAGLLLTTEAGARVWVLVLFAAVDLAPGFRSCIHLQQNMFYALGFQSGGVALRLLNAARGFEYSRYLLRRPRRLERAQKRSGTPCSCCWRRRRPLTDSDWRN